MVIKELSDGPQGFYKGVKRRDSASDVRTGSLSLGTALGELTYSFLIPYLLFDSFSLIHDQFL